MKGVGRSKLTPDLRLQEVATLQRLIRKSLSTTRSLTFHRQDFMKRLVFIDIHANAKVLGQQPDEVNVISYAAPQSIFQMNTKLQRS